MTVIALTEVCAQLSAVFYLLLWLLLLSTPWQSGYQSAVIISVNINAEVIVIRCAVEIAAGTRTKENPVMRLKYHIKPRILLSGTVARSQCILYTGVAVWRHDINFSPESRELHLQDDISNIFTDELLELSRIIGPATHQTSACSNNVQISY